MTLEVMPASYVDGCFVGSDFHISNIAYVVQNRQIRETKKEMEIEAESLNDRRSERRRML
jgi:hypothetical protein